MKIKLLVPLNGPNGGGSEGDVIEWSDDEAYRLIEAGYAEFEPAVSEPDPVSDGAVADESKPANRTRKAK